MIEEAVGPRQSRGETLKALAREDLELYGREELNERIDLLKAEIAGWRLSSCASTPGSPPPTPCSVSRANRLL